MSKVEVDQVDPQSGTTLTLGTSGDTVSIPSGVTLANSGTMTGVPVPTSGIAASAIDSGTIATARLGSGTASSSTFLRGDQTYATPAGGTNTPAFLAYRSSSNLGIPNDVYTKFIFNAEKYDTASAYDTSSGLFTVPSGQAGKYALGGMLFMGGASAPRFILRMRLNNATTLIFMDGEKTAPCTAFATTVRALSVGDTVQIDAIQNSGAQQDYDYSNTAEVNYFFGYKIIE